MKRFFIVGTWLATTITTLVVSVWAYSLIYRVNASTLRPPQVLGLATGNRPSLAYAAIPGAVTELTTAVKAKDARPVVIDEYLREHKSPMVGLGAFIVQKATELGEKNRIDPTYLAFLTIAIAQNESNLGKHMPPNCHNAWGYGIHSAGTLCFGTWEEGSTRFMTGVAEDYIAKRGLDTPDEIMTRYTPQSPDGAWAKGVNQFLDDLYQAGR